MVRIKDEILAFGQQIDRDILVFLGLWAAYLLIFLAWRRLFSAPKRLNTSTASPHSFVRETVAGTIDFKSAKGYGNFGEFLTALFMTSKNYQLVPSQLANWRYRGGAGSSGIDGIFVLFTDGTGGVLNTGADREIAQIVVTETKVGPSTTGKQQMDRNWIRGRLTPILQAEGDASDFARRVAKQSLEWLNKNDPRLECLLFRHLPEGGTSSIVPLDHLGNELGAGVDISTPEQMHAALKYLELFKVY